MNKGKATPQAELGTEVDTDEKVFEEAISPESKEKLWREYIAGMLDPHNMYSHLQLAPVMEPCQDACFPWAAWNMCGYVSGGPNPCAETGREV